MNGVSEDDSRELLYCRVQVARETPDGAIAVLHWDFPAQQFDQIVARMTARWGPPLFEQELSAAELAQIGRNAQGNPMGVRRWPRGKTAGLVAMDTVPVGDSFAGAGVFTIPEAGWYDFGDGVPRKLTDDEVRERGLP